MNVFDGYKFKGVLAVWFGTDQPSDFQLSVSIEPRYFTLEYPPVSFPADMMVDPHQRDMYGKVDAKIFLSEEEKQSLQTLCNQIAIRVMKEAIKNVQK